MQQQNTKHSIVASVASRVLGIALIALAVSANAWASEGVLLNFNGTDGRHPWGNMVADQSGDLHGVTATGGIDCPQNTGCGLVFRLSKVSGVWKETVPHKFTGGNDGYLPNSLILDSAGNVYGTTMNGGGRGGQPRHRLRRGLRIDTRSYGDVAGKDPLPFRRRQWRGPGRSGFRFARESFWHDQERGRGITTCAPTGGCGVLFELTPTASVPWTLTSGAPISL